MPAGTRRIPHLFPLILTSGASSDRRGRIIAAGGPRRRDPFTEAALLGSPGPSPGAVAVFDAVVNFMTDQVAQYGYVAVFGLMLIQAICVPIPSEVTLLFGGALTSSSFAAPGQELNLLLVGLAGTAGNVAGSLLAYWVGYAGGRPLVDRWGRYVLLTPHEIDRAHAWFERHGEAAVFFARLLPVVRTFISLPAGVARMNLLRFTIYTVLGCAIWSFAFAVAGYRLGQSWDRIEAVVRPFSLVLAVAFLAAVVWWVASRVRRLRAAPTRRG
jgi:membrane protein DedA with SNARE-associated domain